MAIVLILKGDCTSIEMCLKLTWNDTKDNNNNNNNNRKVVVDRNSAFPLILVWENKWGSFLPSSVSGQTAILNKLAKFRNFQKTYFRPFLEKPKKFLIVEIVPETCNWFHLQDHLLYRYETCVCPYSYQFFIEQTLCLKHEFEYNNMGSVLLRFF